MPQRIGVGRSCFMFSWVEPAGPQVVTPADLGGDARTVSRPEGLGLLAAGTRRANHPRALV